MSVVCARHPIPHVHIPASLLPPQASSYSDGTSGSQHFLSPACRDPPHQKWPELLKEQQRHQCPPHPTALLLSDHLPLHKCADISC